MDAVSPHPSLWGELKHQHQLPLPHRHATEHGGSLGRDFLAGWGCHSPAAALCEGRDLTDLLFSKPKTGRVEARASALRSQGTNRWTSRLSRGNEDGQRVEGGLAVGKEWENNFKKWNRWKILQTTTHFLPQPVTARLSSPPGTLAGIFIHQAILELHGNVSGQDPWRTRSERARLRRTQRLAPTRRCLPHVSAHGRASLPARRFLHP